ncbi:transcriptional regulator of NAD metabolism [Sporosarcina luteola]|nr:transcriptional regulator of NAD metabolism [Sporosarcina luteola]
MNQNEKMTGDERREFLLTTLQNSNNPLTGKELGELTNVSRQVIVGDMTLLKAKNAPIVATSQGYIYMDETPEGNKFEQVIVCRHTPEQTEEELNIFVDHGVTVKDVKVEHPVYGDLSASIMVSNRRDVKEFLKRIEEANAAYLSNLSDDGIHLHTVVAERNEQITDAVAELKKAGILLE